MPTIEQVPQYTAGELFAILESIGDWVFTAGLIIAAVMVLVGAGFLLTGGDNPNRVSTGKDIFLWAAIGLGLTFLAKAVFTVLREIFGG